MKKGTIIILTVVALVVIWGISAYNGIATLSHDVSNSWAQVESQYQRRSDLILNLVATVKGYAEHESSTLESVVAARAKATQVTVDSNDITPEAMAEYQKAQGEIGSALGRLLMIQEAYPDLKANENFKELQAQLEGTENRIAVERKRFNDATRAFNVKIVRFPNNLIAGLFGFGEKPYFEAAEGADKAPVVEF